MNLKLHLDYLNGLIVLGPNRGQALVLPPFTYQDKVQFELHFVEPRATGYINQGAYVTVPVAPFTVEMFLGQRGLTAEAGQNNWTRDEPNDLFTGTLDLNTTQLQTALGTGTEIERVIEIRVLQGSERFTIQQRVKVRKPVQPIGAPDPTTYEPPPNLIANLAPILADSDDIDVQQQGSTFVFVLKDGGRVTKHTAASEAAMLALTAKKGDLCERTDLNRVFVLTTSAPSQLANWFMLPVGFEWEGAWSAGTTYAKDDAVSKNGSSYISLQSANLNHDPAISANIGVWWDVLALGSTAQPSDSLPAAQMVGDTGAVGTATKFARGDHKHPLPAKATSTADGFESKEDKDRFNRSEIGAFDGEVFTALLDGNWLYLAGPFTQFDNVTAPKITKLDLRLKVDPHFTVGTGFSAAPNFLAKSSDGSLFAGASAKTSLQGGNLSWVHKFNTLGVKDPAFGDVDTIAATGSDQLLGLAPLNGRLAVLSWRTLRIINATTGLSLFHADGSGNLHFIRSHGDFVYLASRPTSNYDGILNPRAVKKLYFPPNEADPEYGGIDSEWNGNAGTGGSAATNGIVVSPDGSQVVVANIIGAFDGTDYTWNGQGGTNHKGFYRLNSDGTRDANWTVDIAMVNANDWPVPFALDGQGRLYFGGNVASVNGTAVTAWRLYRVNADGTGLVQFNAFNDAVNGVLVIGDDRLLVFGRFTQVGQLKVGRIFPMDDNGNRLHHLLATDQPTRTGVYREEWIDAGMMVKRSWRGATPLSIEFPATYYMADIYRFSGAQQEHVNFKLANPDAWDRLQIKVKFFWLPGNGASIGETVSWQIKAGARGDGDRIDTALGNLIEVTDTIHTAATDAVHVTEATGQLAVGQNPQPGDVCLFEISRNALADTLNVSADLLGIQIQYREAEPEPAAW